MNTHARTPAIALLFLAMSTSAIARSAEPPSSGAAGNQGFYLGARLGAAGLTWTRESETAHGAIGGVAAGYFFTPRLGLELSGVSGRIGSERADRPLVAHTDLHVRYRFTAPQRSWAPFVQAGPTWRSFEIDRADGNGPARVSRVQSGLSVGGGVGYRLSPSLTFETSLIYTGGRLSGVECPIGTRGERSCVVSSRLSVGVTWQPGQQR